VREGLPGSAVLVHRREGGESTHGYASSAPWSNTKELDSILEDSHGGSQWVVRGLNCK
jgi:hypothetical protein